MIREVIKRDKKKEAFDWERIYRAILKAAKEIYSLSEAQNLAKRTFELVKHKLSRYRKSFIEIEKIQDIVEEALMRLGYTEVAKAYILYRRYRQEVRLIKSKLGVKDELKLSLNAIEVLRDRYLLRDKNQRVIETPKQLFERVAKFVASAERNFDSSKEELVQEKFYNTMVNLEFLPNSPTLMNAGTGVGQLSACFVLPVGDSMEEIFDSLKAMGIIHKTGGGTGFNFSFLRPQGDCVFSTKGRSSGPVSFMRIFDTATSVIVQGGRRRGANMAVLRIDHPDIVEFVEAKLDGVSFSNFNLSCGVTNKFMDALKYNKKFELINPRTKKCVRKIKAKELFSAITFSAYKCGDPGLVFLDTINRAHPLKSLGKIGATNPCGEVPLLNYESCNLGSINLSKFVKDKKMDWARLREVIHLGIRFLDNVIEVNNYPLKEIKEITIKNRKVGLGVMGFADALVKLRIPYASKEAVDFSAKLMKFIREASLEASFQLARERGVFSNWKFSIYRKKNLRLRNATLNSIAPTGTISIIAGCSSGIEPLFALSFVRNVLGGAKLLEINPLVEEVAREEGIYSKELMYRIQGLASLKEAKVPLILKRIFLTTFDISPLDHLKIQAAFQKFVDNAVSKTINLPSHASPEDIKAIYLKAYQFRLKGITVYRYGSRKDQVLTLGSRREEPIEVVQGYAGGCFSHICGG